MGTKTDFSRMKIIRYLKNIKQPQEDNFGTDNTKKDIPLQTTLLNNADVMKLYLEMHLCLPNIPCFHSHSHSKSIQSNNSKYPSTYRNKLMQTLGSGNDVRYNSETLFESNFLLINGSTFSCMSTKRRCQSASIFSRLCVPVEQFIWLMHLLLVEKNNNTNTEIVFFLLVCTSMTYFLKRDTHVNILV